jgi:hypothetical protein
MRIEAEEAADMEIPETPDNEEAGDEEEAPAGEEADGDEEDADGEGDEEGDGDGDETDGEEEEEGDQAPPAKGHRKPGAERRIDKLTATIYEQRAQMQQLLDMNRQLLEQTKPPPAPLPPRPKHADFDTDEEYEDALYDWRQIKSERAAAEKNPKQPASPNGPKGANGQPVVDPVKVKAYREQETAAKAKYSDFDQVVNNPNLMVSDAMVQLVLKNKSGAELAYWLGKHPNESARIALLPADEVAVEIGKVVGRLEAAPKGPAPKKKPPEPPLHAKPSKAPAPMTPVGGKAQAVKDPSKMSMEEYAKYMDQKERKKNRR